ncbi:MAG: sensor histidine kinase [Lawsonibacter sp.]
MRKLTIKLKITLWFTSFMILLSCVVFAFIAFVSDSTATRQVTGALTRQVDENVHAVKNIDGRVDIGGSFVFFRNGIYCLVFSKDGGKIAGDLPYEALEEEPLKEGGVRMVNADGEAGLIYDRLVELKGHEDVWVRGVVLEKSSIASSAVSRAVLVALPLLIVLAAGGGYLIAGRSLRPIQKISETANEIGRSGDLSKRIELEGSGDELHKLADSFNRMFQQLETNFEAERNFTSDASHELRMPVTVILAQCEYALENASGEQELYEAISVIQHQGYRMSRLIESLLNFTRMEQRTESIAFEPVELSELVKGICQEQEDFDDKHITLTEEIQPGIKIEANQSLMTRMVGNLIRNAYRYGKENGKIWVSLNKTGQEVALSVADDGIGIEEEELPKIWNRFYRVDKARSSAEDGGLGLGLAMVKQIAELHGGSVQAESVLGHGSVFTVSFKIEG